MSFSKLLSRSLYALTVCPYLDVDNVNAVTVMVSPWVHQEVNDVSSVDVEPPLNLLPVGAALWICFVAPLEQDGRLPGA